jgi:hypothetical protein
LNGHTIILDLTATCVSPDLFLRKGAEILAVWTEGRDPGELRLVIDLSTPGTFTWIPPVASPDSQTVKATRTSGQRGYDAGKKINGVKRHIVVHTLGLLLAVVVHPANIQDRDGAKLAFAKAQLLGPWPRMKRAWADGGHAGKLIAWVGSFCQWILEIVK